MPHPGGGEGKNRTMVTTTTTNSAGHGYCFSDDALGTATTGHHHVVSGQFQIQSFDHESNPEIYGLTNDNNNNNNNNSTGGMEMMMIGFPNKNNLHQPINSSSTNVMWKEFFGKSSGPSSSSSSKSVINIVPPEAVATVGSHHHPHHEFYNQPDFSTDTASLMVDAAAAAAASTTTTWQDNRLQIHHHHHHEAEVEQEEEEEEEDPSSMRCVFNERPSQQGGLSLSLGSSSNINNIPSTIGLQSFELLRQQQQQQPHPHHEDIIRFAPSSSSRDGGGELFFGKSANIQQQQQQQMFLMMQAESIGIHGHGGGQFQIRSSKYLAPAQELLNEFCNLGTKQQHQNDRTKLLKFQKTTHQWPHHQQEDQETKIQQSSNLYSLDLLELQKRKSKLLQMLEEVDRRYKHYCNQMRAVVASFEAVAGNGAASVYSALASKAMSKHFRCLRDGIVGQIKATKKALGEKDNSTSATAPGTTRGETPRLRLIDQTLRQQKAFQQMSMMESHPWRPQRGLPERAVSVLRAWLFEHFLHPYPSDVDKHILARQTGLSRSQVSNWFINARVRLWKPMVEEMYLEETKELENMMGGSSDGDKSLDLDDDSCTGGGVSRRQQQNQNPHHQSRRTSHHHHHHDQDEEKPTADQLVRIDSECLSSIINNNNNNTQEKNDLTKTIQDELQANLQSFGRVTDSFGAMELDFSSYNHHQQNIRGGGSGGVSLTLGLQQNSGVSLAFSPSASQTSLFYARENDHHMNEDCTPAVVQYSLLDSETQNLPYRNLMGAQLLHDLAG